MQGFILSVKKAKNEDTIVRVLTPQKLLRLYRFYGARHPIVTAGYKIDFEVERDGSPFLPRLRHVVHLGFPWLKEPERLQIWQYFISLMSDHLQAVEVPGTFYYDLLQERAAVWHLQNPKRASVEAYLSLLRHEGRLHPPTHCFACQRPLKERTALIRAYLPAHPHCVIAQNYPTTLVHRTFESGSTIDLDDKMVEAWWLTMLEGF